MMFSLPDLVTRHCLGHRLSNGTFVLIGALVFGGAGLRSPALARDAWTPTSAPTRYWWDVASSADGTRLVAVVGLGGGPIYTSTNSGTSWSTNNNAPVRFWETVASSADGTRLVAAPSGPGGEGPIYASIDAGATWTATASPVTYWSSVASSADGMFLVASDGGSVYTSATGGATWTGTALPGAVAVACSSDGTRLAAVSDRIYLSTNAGGTWKAADVPPGIPWVAIASSGDGSKLIAVASDWDQPGPACISVDAGASWTSTGKPSAVWVDVACSADGTRIFAVAGGGFYSGLIYSSTDAGATWTTADAPVAGWHSVACSADGTKAVAAIWGGTIYTCRSAPALTLRRADANLAITWPAPSAEFRLERKSTLDAGAWERVAAAAIVTNAQNRWLVAPPFTNSFYRLVSP